MNQIDYRRHEHTACYELYGRVCAKCGKPATQLAHIIAAREKSPALLPRFGWAFIYSRFNMRPVCDLDCNKKVQCRLFSESELMLNAHKIWFAMAEENIGEGL